MNMNRSGHAEMPDPHWYADRANKLSPTNTIETESVNNSSFASLNLDTLTIADLDNLEDVRSLPIVSSSGSASIAATPDAPWNESPRSLRSNYKAKPPTGVSALDHLQQSISSITTPAAPPVLSIVALEDESSDEGSSSSLRTAELDAANSKTNNNTGTTNEMDATAHAGNVSRSAQFSYPPLSPQRSATRYTPYSPSRVRQPHCDASYAGSSITSRGSMNRRNRRTHQAGQQEASVSTLGDEEDDFDDDNLQIIQLLRRQVETLKEQLLEQQQQNQLNQHSRKDSFSMSQGSSTCFGNDCDDEDEDEECSFGDDVDEAKLQNTETAARASIEALKTSFRKQQEAATRDQRTTVEHQPVGNATNDEQLLMDELLLCELEQQIKSLLRQQAQQHKQMQEQAAKHAARIVELEAQCRKETR